MRILVISGYYPPFELGGWEQLTRDVINLMKERGHQTQVLTSNYKAEQVTTPEPGIARLLHLESLDHEYYHPQYTLTYRWRKQQNRRYLAQAVTQFTPDVIFVNSMWNLSSDIVRYAEQLCPGRVIYYIASVWPTDVDPHIAYWQSQTARPILNWPKQWVGRLACKLFASASPRHQLDFAHVLCVSEFMQRYMVNEVGVPLAQTSVVYNGINPTVFKPNPKIHNGNNGPLQLLYAGGLLKHKGVHTAIEAMGHLINNLGIKNVHLTLIGSGPPYYVDHLKARIQALNIEQWITFGERVPRSQMPALLQQYDIFLFPSTGPEALARMTQEAMACGMVVIGSTTGGTPEILHDGENGLTFEADNPSMLADRIAQAVNDKTLRIRLAQAARQTIEERFTLRRMVDELEAYFSDVIAQPIPIR